MGNVNGREDESESSSSKLDQEATVIDNPMNPIAAVGSQSHPLPPLPPNPLPELMSLSPPHSPRAVHSPLLFTPQVPVVPLQKPDEMQILNQSWMHVTFEHEDVVSEHAIPTMITWTYSGKEVAVEGSWDDWKAREPLQSSGKDFSIVKMLPSGVYRYRFIVDGQWRYSPELPWAQDESGNCYNVLDLHDYVPDDIESISGFEPPLSPESSYNNTQLNSEDFAKEPPLVPPHLQMTLLNAPSSCMEIMPPLSRPPHVVLNHLYMQKAKSGPSVVALGSTHRFLSKYILGYSHCHLCVSHDPNVGLQATLQPLEMQDLATSECCPAYPQ